MRFGVAAVALVVAAACSSTYAEEPFTAPDAGPNLDDASANGTDAAPFTDGAGLDAGFDRSSPCLGALDCERIVFVSSSKGDGNQGGVGAADIECQELADRSSKTAGRKFKAFLGFGGTSAESRFARGTRAYRRTDGLAVADSFAHLISDEPFFVPINVDENGVVLAGSEPVWTGANGKGERSGGDCNAWASVNNDGRVGLSSSVDSKWASNGDVPCVNEARLYCVEE